MRLYNNAAFSYVFKRKLYYSQRKAHVACSKIFKEFSEFVYKNDDDLTSIEKQ